MNTRNAGTNGRPAQDGETSAARPRVFGVVHSFDAGWGFIATSAGRRTFVHARMVQHKNKTLVPGEYVSFIRGNNPADGRECAIDVRRESGAEQ